MRRITVRSRYLNSRTGRKIRRRAGRSGRDRTRETRADVPRVPRSGRSDRESEDPTGSEDPKILRRERFETEPPGTSRGKFRGYVGRSGGPEEI
jgi:hypothetical protein